MHIYKVLQAQVPGAHICCRVQGSKTLLYNAEYLLRGAAGTGARSP